MHRRLGGAASAAVLVALMLHLPLPAALAANVTTQVAPFTLTGTISATCFLDAAVAALDTLHESSTIVEAAISTLAQTLISVVVDVDVDGEVSIERHGQNGAVHRVAWSAALTQASLALTAAHTTQGSATVCASTLSRDGVTRVGGG